MGQKTKHPERHSARSLLRYAIRAGKIVRPDNCQKCGTLCKPDGHHADYTKPLDVMWLCKPCHVEEHARLRHAGNPVAVGRSEPIDVYHEVACPDCGGLGYHEVVNVRKIRLLRKESGISLRIMADKLGISASYLSDMELGRRRMSFELAEEIVRMCEAPKGVRT